MPFDPANLRREQSVIEANFKLADITASGRDIPRILTTSQDYVIFE